MILTKEAIEEMKKYYAINNGCTQAQEDIFNLCDTIESQSTQIEQLQAKIYQPGNCYMCKVSMQNEEMELIHETDMEEIERLQARLEGCKEAIEKALDNLYCMLPCGDCLENEHGQAAKKVLEQALQAIEKINI